MEHSLVQLTPRKQRAVHLYLTGHYTLKNMAELIGVDINTIRGWLRDPQVREYIEEFQKEEHEVAENAIKDLRTKALGRLGDLMDSPNDNVALQAVKDVLDRSGHKSVQRIEKDVTVKTFEQQMTDLMGTVSMPVIDVVANEVQNEVQDNG